MRFLMSPHFKKRLAQLPTLGQLAKNARINLLFSALAVGVILSGAMATKEFWNGQRSAKSQERKGEFVLYASAKQKKATPWKFSYSGHQQNWVLGQNDKNPLITFKGLYLQHQKEPPRFFRYWVSKLPRKLQKKAFQKQNDVHTATLYMSDLPKGMLKESEEPGRHIVAVTFTRKNDRLKLRARPYGKKPKKTHDWEILSWRVESTKKTSALDKRVVFHIPQKRLPSRGLSSTGLPTK